MTMRDIAGFILIPLVLLIAAGAINALSLWSVLGNFTVPWFCTALALAVLIVGTTCVLLQCPPSAIPAHHARLVIAAVLLIIGIGLAVDMFAYSEYESADRLASVGEWVGFAVILIGAFWLPRLRVPASETQSPAPGSA